jgi:biopolymer transport protein ExbD
MSVDYEQESFSSDEEERILEMRNRDAKRKKRLARRGGNEGGALNINSMMDILTIILVFLVDNYGNNPIQVKAGPDLIIPSSVSELTPEDTMQITITRKAVIVGDKQVVNVKDGQIDKSQKRGGENSLYIQPLFDELTEEVSRHKQMAALRRKPFEGVVTIVADRTVPYRLLTEVMYTAGQAQLANFKFAIVKFGRADKAKKANNSK